VAWPSVGVGAAEVAADAPEEIPTLTRNNAMHKGFTRPSDLSKPGDSSRGLAKLNTENLNIENVTL